MLKKHTFQCSAQRFFDFWNLEFRLFRVSNFKFKKLTMNFRCSPRWILWCCHWFSSWGVSINGGTNGWFIRENPNLEFMIGDTPMGTRIYIYICNMYIYIYVYLVKSQFWMGKSTIYGNPQVSWRLFCRNLMPVWSRGSVRLTTSDQDLREPRILHLSGTALKRWKHWAPEKAPLGSERFREVHVLNKYDIYIYDKICMYTKCILIYCSISWFFWCLFVFAVCDRKIRLPIWQ